MKKIILIMALCMAIFPILINAQSQGNTVFQFNEGSTAKLFADSANVRLAPNAGAAMVTALPVNYVVKILKQDTTVLQAGERAANWYYISFDKDGLSYEGYIWGANLCIGYRHRGEYDFLFGITKTEQRVSSDNSKYGVNIAAVKLLKNNVLADQVSFDAGSSENLTGLSFRADDKIKLKNISNVIIAEVTGAACGIPTYTQYLLLKNDKLIAMPLLTTVGDADIFAHEEEYIFPSFEVGSIIKRTTDYEKDEKTGKEKKTVKNEYYRWDGEQLTKVAR